MASDRIAGGVVENWEGEGVPEGTYSQVCIVREIMYHLHLRRTSVLQQNSPFCIRRSECKLFGAHRSAILHGFSAKTRG